MGDARHTRSKGRGRPRRARLRQISVTMLVMLVIQYGLGIILNLYVEVPASDAHAGILTEIATRDRLLAVLATAGLTALGGAFGTGEIFVRNGQNTASMAMAILTGMALLCYIGTLTLATAAGREEGAQRPAPVFAAVPAARSAERAHYPAAWPDSPGETTGSWFIRE